MKPLQLQLAQHKIPCTPEEYLHNVDRLFNILKAEEQFTGLPFNKLKIIEELGDQYAGWLIKLIPVFNEYMRIKNLLPLSAWSMYLKLDVDNRETRLLNNQIIQMRKLLNERPRPRKKVKEPRSRSDGSKKQHGSNGKNVTGTRGDNHDSKRERACQ
jgi:hypothetical protein